MLSTLHTNDAVSTPIRLLDMGAPRYMVAMSLQVVVAQRLMRIICESCAQPTELLANEHEWMRNHIGAAADGRTYLKGRGCAQCNGTGYLGRTGVYEMLEMTRPVVEAANQPDPARFVEAARAQMAGQMLTDHAVQLVISGRTTVEEAMRISTHWIADAQLFLQGGIPPANWCRAWLRAPTAPRSQPSCSPPESRRWRSRDAKPHTGESIGLMQRLTQRPVALETCCCQPAMYTCSRPVCRHACALGLQDRAPILNSGGCCKEYARTWTAAALSVACNVRTECFRHSTWPWFT